MHGASSVPRGQLFRLSLAAVSQRLPLRLSNHVQQQQQSRPRQTGPLNSSVGSFCLITCRRPPRYPPERGTERSAGQNLRHYVRGNNATTRKKVDKGPTKASRNSRKHLISIIERLRQGTRRPPRRRLRGGRSSMCFCGPRMLREAFSWLR